MLLSINYSKQAAQLYHQGKIYIDRFKCPDWPDMVAEAKELRPISVHFSLKAGRGKLEKVDWDEVFRFMDQNKTPYVNLHLEAKVKDFPHIPVDTTDPLHQEEIIQQVISDLQIAKKYFDPQKIILENVPYRGNLGNILRPVVEPRIIRQIVEMTDCGLLLDISHARISAISICMNEHDYLSQLPVKRLRELHFTGVHNLDGWLQDHLPALEADWLVLDWVLEHIQKGTWSKPWMLAFEYGGIGERFEKRSDPMVISEQLPIINRKIKEI